MATVEQNNHAPSYAHPGGRPQNDDPKGTINTTGRYPISTVLHYIIYMVVMVEIQTEPYRYSKYLDKQCCFLSTVNRSKAGKTN